MMRCTPDEDDGYVLYESRLFEMQTEGALCLRYLHALLHGDPARLGWAPVTLTQNGALHIVGKLGVGATSVVVYEAVAVQATAAGPTHYAVKVMTRRSGLDRDLFKAEDRTLRNVRRLLAVRNELLELVPVPVELLAGGRVLVQSPVGRPLASRGVPANFVAPLVALLRVLHARYVHRDLRLPNVLELNGGPLLVDWGYAAPVGQQAVPAAALLHSPLHIRQSAQRGEATHRPARTTCERCCASALWRGGRMSSHSSMRATSVAPSFKTAFSLYNLSSLDQCGRRQVPVQETNFGEAGAEAGAARRLAM